MLPMRIPGMFLLMGVGEVVSRDTQRGMLAQPIQ